MGELPHSRSLRRGRFSQPGQIYWVTTVSADRSPVFADFVAARQVVKAMHAASIVSVADTLAFVVMPDHVHWLMQLKEGVNLGEAVRRFKAKTTLALGRRVWQRGFHDHALRNEEEIPAVGRYVVANPVRAGLVEKVGDYPHWDADWLEDRFV